MAGAWLAAFQTCNPLHRAHVELKRRALAIVDDRRPPPPLVGRAKGGGMDTYPRTHCCCASVKLYPPEAVELSVLPLTRSTTDVKPPKIMRLPSKGH